MLFSCVSLTAVFFSIFKKCQRYALWLAASEMAACDPNLPIAIPYVIPSFEV